MQYLGELPYFGWYTSTLNTMEANYNPHSPANMKRGDEALNKLHARQSGTCTHKFSTGAELELDRCAGKCLHRLLASTTLERVTSQ
jgi:hypothetical protein